MEFTATDSIGRTWSFRATGKNRWIGTSVGSGHVYIKKCPGAKRLFEGQDCRPGNQTSTNMTHDDPEMLAQLLLNRKPPRRLNDVRQVRPTSRRRSAHD